tara:strand:- start:848 stop:1210 length:363 start_codon:yes stop_codon:yes gene_type:complete
MYEPQVNDYVIWTTELGHVHEGWVYFKGESADNQMRIKNGWRPVSRYITIEVCVRRKSNVTKNDPHKMIHTLLICNSDHWHELKFVKKRMNRMCEHYSQYDDVHGIENNILKHSTNRTNE